MILIEFFEVKKKESDEFYDEIQKILTAKMKKCAATKLLQLLWNKQFYHYKVGKWLNGTFPVERILNIM